jgi:hypothetical protein
MQLLDLSTDMFFACTSAISCHLNIHTIFSHVFSHVYAHTLTMPHSQMDIVTSVTPATWVTCLENNEAS